MSEQSRIWSKHGLWGDGKVSDFLRIPYSSNVSAYGWIPVPFVSIKNGAGPTVLFVAGNHGDEYEGQIVLRDLARAIRIEDVSGHILILPALNFPAVVEGARVSPLDSGNLNRSFPGNARGTPTEMLAHFLASELIPKVDLVVDLHSGGRSLTFMPCALAKYDDGTSQIEKKNLELLRAFGAPISYLTSGKGGGAGTTLAAAAQAANIPAIMTELGGGERIDPIGLEIAERGLRNVLSTYGVMDGGAGQKHETKFMRVRGQDDYVYAHRNGIYQPLVSLGEQVTEGQAAARIFDLEAPLDDPEICVFEASGTVACQRAQSRVHTGDCLFHLFSEVEIGSVN